MSLGVSIMRPIVAPSAKTIGDDLNSDVERRGVNVKGRV